MPCPETPAFSSFSKGFIMLLSFSAMMACPAATATVDSVV